jgi:hypothetical protein
MQLDIVKGAGLTVAENDYDGLRLRPYELQPNRCRRSKATAGRGNHLRGEGLGHEARRPHRAAEGTIESMLELINNLVGLARRAPDAGPEGTAAKIGSSLPSRSIQHSR